MCYNLTRVSVDTCQIARVSTVTGTVDTRQNAKILVVHFQGPQTVETFQER